MGPPQYQEAFRDLMQRARFLDRCHLLAFTVIPSLLQCLSNAITLQQQRIQLIEVSVIQGEVD